MVDKIEEEIEWVDVETTTRAELISCAFYAISSVEEMDIKLMTRIEANKIKKIKKQSLDIIAEVINELHEEIFPTTEDIEATNP